MKKLKKFVYRLYYDHATGQPVGATFAEIITGWCRDNKIQIPKDAKFPVGSCVFLSDLDRPLVSLRGHPESVKEHEAELLIYGKD